MTKNYEVYINGSLATKTITLIKADKVAAKYPAARVEVYRIIPTVQTELIYQRGPLCVTR